MKHYLYAFDGRCSIVSAEYADKFCNNVKSDFTGTYDECVKYTDSNHLFIIEDFL